VKTTDKVILGLPVKFVSLGSMAPLVNDFFPKTGTWGDTITIKGKNFGYSLSESMTYFGTVTSRVISIQDTLLETIVPQNLSDDSCLIAVDVMGNRSTAREKFVLESPAKIIDFSPKEAEWMDTITLNGIFPAAIPVNIYIDNSLAPVVYKTESLIKVIIPVNAMSYEGIEILLSFNNHGIYSSEKLFIKRPYIQAMPEMKGKTGDTITLTGLFNPDSKNTNILLDGASLSLLRCQKKELKFKIPSPVNSLSPSIVISSGGLILNENALFEYEKPRVTSISAAEINTFSSIQINGTGFLPNKTTVLFDDIPLTIVSMDDNKIIAKPVQSLVTKTYALKVRVLDYILETGHNISYGIPEFTSFYPKEATFLDTVTIYFKNITQKNLRVSFESEIYPDVVSQDKEMLKFIVPDRLNKSHYYMFIHSGSDIIAQSPFKFALKRPVFSSFSPYKGFLDQPFEIIGANFCPIKESNSILVGNHEVIISELSPTRISGIIPNIPAGTYSVVYKIADLNVVITNAYLHTGLWTPIGQRPDNSVGDRNFTHLQHNGRFYLIGGYDYWGNSCNGAGYFDIESKTWHDIAEFPGGKRGNMSGFVLNNKLYSGMGSDMYGTYYSDFYAYDPSSNTWIKAPSFPGPTRNGAVCFAINGKAYIGGGYYQGSYYKNLYEFESTTSQWKRTIDLPETDDLVISLAVDDIAYLFYYYKNQFWIFDPSTSQFTQKSFPDVSFKFYVCSAFAIGEKIYAIVENNGEGKNEFWVYDTQSDTWTRLYDIPMSHYSYSTLYCVSYKDKGYMYIGYEYDLDYDRKFLEYDPSMEP
jgi:N-acetylneuraminic acid mutarotase